MTVRKTTPLIKGLIRKILVRFISHPWERKAFDLRQDFPADVVLRRDSLTLESLSLIIPRRSFEFLLDAYNLAVDLRKRNARFFLRDELLFITIEGITLNLTTAEEIFIVHEVFFKGVYAVDISGSCSVVDVGMNVGIATLYFAALPHVREVFAFEPFIPTYQQGFQNISLNSGLSGKIVAENFGLAQTDQTLEVEYDYSNKGQVGIHGTDLIRSSVEKVEAQRIALRRASTVIASVLGRCTGSHLLLKLDCEGSEYGIVEDLAEQGLLEKFDTIMVEWHERGYEQILTHLRRTGFTSFYQQTSPNIGMIYATK